MSVSERPYLSIGEVLGLLLEEFPDVTISKIRFLESQGLIEPERTSSGYRKFYDGDIERLRVILREQKDNYLPLRVIRDRLETGEIDDSGGIPMPTISELPRGIRNVPVAPLTGRTAVFDDDDAAGDDPTGTISRDVAEVVTSRHPAAQSRPLAVVDTASRASERAASTSTPATPRVLLRNELCSQAGITAQQLSELESYGIVTGRGTGSNATYTDSDLAIVRAAAGFLARGIDTRHLRGWKQAAEREVGLFEQRIMPLLRQRNPQARADALQLIDELASLGADLRASLVASMLEARLDQ